MHHPKKQLQNLLPELRSEEVQEILTQVPHSILQYGNTLLLLLFILLFSISFFVKYPDIISAHAVLTSQIPPQKEYAQTTGKLESILVYDNEYVKPNQILAIIENTANHEDILFLQNLIDTLKIDYKSFIFPLEQLPTMNLGELETDFALFENAYIQYQLNKNLQPFSNEANANTYTIRELQNQLSNLENQKTIHEKELHFKQIDLERQKSLFDRGVIAAQEYEHKQLEYLQAERSLKNMSNSISITRDAISSANKTYKGTEIYRTKEEIVLLKNVIQSFHILKERIKDWELKYVLKSELEGNVTFLKVWSENQSVNQGDLVCTIVPSHQKQYVAKLKTPAFNSGKIKVGQLVHLKLDNYPETEFGMLQGEVQNISLTPDHEGLYIIDVKLPSQLITSYHKEIKFQQEMTATAEIITEDLVLIERLFYSFIKLGQR